MGILKIFQILVLISSAVSDENVKYVDIDEEWERIEVANIAEEGKDPYYKCFFYRRDVFGDLQLFAEYNNQYSKEYIDIGVDEQGRQCVKFTEQIYFYDEIDCNEEYRHTHTIYRNNWSKNPIRIELVNMNPKVEFPAFPPHITPGFKNIDETP